MDWRCEGIILGGRRYGESGLILDVLTNERGKRSGLVYGGAGRRKRPALEAGNTIDLEWRGRVADQLGHFSVAETTSQRAASLMTDRDCLEALTTITTILHTSLPEDVSYPGLYDATSLLLDSLNEPDLWPALYVRWEAGLLSLLGYGLDTRSCPLTGATDGLTHVSPKTGRAVQGDAAGDYIDRLIPLPAFMVDAAAEARPQDIGAGLHLTGFFLTRRLYADTHRPPPECRDRMLRRLEANGQISMGEDPDIDTAV